MAFDPYHQAALIRYALRTTLATDKRKRLPGLSADGIRFEQALRREQVKLLQRVFGEAGQAAVDGWVTVNQALA
jgi:hypothetical protein